jgi:surface polysaccharide O-acyltransferase-like enzyme
MGVAKKTTTFTTNATRGNIESLKILRIMATLAVIIVHVSSYILLNEKNIHSINWWAANLFASSVRWSVPMFVLISGALLLDPLRKQSINVFMKKRFKRVFIPLIFWSIFYSCISYCVSGFTINKIILNIIFGRPYYHLWFLYMIIGLYLFTPAMKVYTEYCVGNEKYINLLFILVISMSYIFLSIFLSQSMLFLSITLFLPYVGYYICGYHLRTVILGIGIKQSLLIQIAIVLIMAIGTYLLVMKYGQCDKGLYLHSYLSPTVMVGSILLFISIINKESYFRNMTIITNNSIDKISSASLGIYLIHPIIFAFFVKIINLTKTSAIISIPTLSILIFVLSYIVTLIFMKIPYIRRTVI